MGAAAATLVPPAGARSAPCRSFPPAGEIKDFSSKRGPVRFFAARGPFYRAHHRFGQKQTAVIIGGEGRKKRGNNPVGRGSGEGEGGRAPLLASVAFSSPPAAPVSTRSFTMASLVDHIPPTRAARLRRSKSVPAARSAAAGVGASGPGHRRARRSRLLLLLSRRNVCAQTRPPRALPPVWRRWRACRFFGASCQPTAATAAGLDR